MDTTEKLRVIRDRLSVLIRLEEHGISAPATSAFLCSRILIDLKQVIQEVKPKKVSRDTQEMYYELDKLLKLYNANL